jgi:3-demethoxyubiquinol 3-hydroxylase
MLPRRPRLANQSKCEMAAVNTLIEQFDGALRTLHSVGRAQRPYPAASLTGPESLNQAERRQSAGLMRVNHVGEVCAQALYAGQLLTARSPSVRAFNQHAAIEERDHLLWTAQRLNALNAKPSALNPVWYTGAWLLGAVAGLLGDKVSMSFVQETEAQVEAHLHRHESLLPAQDEASLAIVTQMKADEAAHGQQAQALGAVDLPAPMRAAMRASAKVMTATAYYL